MSVDVEGAVRKLRKKFREDCARALTLEDLEKVRAKAEKNAEKALKMSRTAAKMLSLFGGGMASSMVEGFEVQLGTVVSSEYQRRLRQLQNPKSWRRDKLLSPPTTLQSNG